MIKLLLIGLLTLSMVLNYKLYRVNNTTTFTELSISCETGMLLYVTKFDQGPLTTMEKIQRSRIVANLCAEYSSTYMGFKIEPEEKGLPDTKGNQI